MLRRPAAARNHRAGTSRAQARNPSGATTASPNHPASRKTPATPKTPNAAKKPSGARKPSGAKRPNGGKRHSAAKKLSGARRLSGGKRLSGGVRLSGRRVRRLGLRRFGFGRTRLVCATTGICRTRVPSTKATHRSATNLLVRRPANSRTYQAQHARSAPAGAQASSRMPPAKSRQNKRPPTEPAAAPNQPRPPPSQAHQLQPQAKHRPRMQPLHRPPTHPPAAPPRQVRPQLVQPSPARLQSRASEQVRLLLRLRQRVVRVRFRRTVVVLESRPAKVRLLVTV